MGHHLGSNCIRSLPAKGRIAGYTELARVSQRVMRTSSSDPCRFRRTGVTEHWIGLSRQSALMLAARITLPHFSISPATNVLNLSGVFATAVAPKSANRALMSEFANPAFVSLLSLSTISIGVFLGTPTPFQPLAS